MNCYHCKKDLVCNACMGCKHKECSEDFEQIEDYPEPCKTCLSEDGDCKREAE